MPYIIAIAGGALAGFINTLAGSGSAITLGILTEILGLPGNMANGTNRVGIFAQGITTTWTFRKNGKLKLAHSKFYIAMVMIGAVIGIYVATQVSNEQFKQVYKYLMLLTLFFILIKPSRWLKPTQSDFKMKPILAAALFIPLGFYGGFIQMGMGIFFLMVMVILAKVNIMESNAVKIFVVLLYTIIAIAIFAYHGLIDWKLGGIMAIGQATGGWAGAELGSKWKYADKAAYYMLVVIVSLISIRLLVNTSL
ncbi:MAG: sulfite exporter TauE/SafE family protein [Flavobacteriales bacterium]|nr:sulfite exporter TauE/SafE family protein [Flavobacteriales bacterium]